MFKQFWFGFCGAIVVKLQGGAAIWQAEGARRAAVMQPGCLLGFPCQQTTGSREREESERLTERKTASRQSAERLDNPAVGVKTNHDSAQGEM